MKKYVVTITKIQNTNMITEGKNKKQAIKKIKQHISKCLVNGISLETEFNENTVYKFKGKHTRNA